MAQQLAKRQKTLKYANIVIIFPDGYEMYGDVRAHETVKHVMHHIAHRRNVHFTAYDLWYEGVILQRNNSLSRYNMECCYINVIHAIKNNELRGVSFFNADDELRQCQ